MTAVTSRRTARRCVVLATVLLTALLATGRPCRAQGSRAKMTTYMYANPEDVARHKGSLTVRFTTPGENRLVIAYGRKYRKDRKSRGGTTEAQREVFKPWLGHPAERGKAAHFPHLPIDRYDLLIVDEDAMTIHEGIALYKGDVDAALSTPQLLSEIGGSPGMGRWEGFFDTKRWERAETDGVYAGALVQMYRSKRALTGGGHVIKGCIHSIGVVWLAKTKTEDGGWEVNQSGGLQKLYRAEIQSRDFFSHRFVPQLRGIRVVTRPIQLDPLDLAALGME